MLAVLLAATVVGCTSDSDWSGGSTSAATTTRTLSMPDESAPLLFVARSDTGSLQVRPGASSTLELDDVDAMTWFTDRPERDAGTSSITDALGSFGWTRNGDRLSDDAPNGALVAAELGTDSVVVQLLTATVDGSRVRFTVDFVSPPPASTTLTDVELFIDDATVDPAALTPSGLPQPVAGGIVLGRSVDTAGQPHTAVLQLAPGVAASLVTQRQLLAVVSGTSTYSVTGDAAVDDWRFSVDPTVTGGSAPIVVLKFNTSSSLVDLAAQPNTFAETGALLDDLSQTTAQLQALLASVIAGAGSDAGLYGPLAADVQDPAWTGVLVFNASVSTVPGTVGGQSTGALAGTSIPAISVGFDLAPSQPVDALFGVVDATGSTPGVPSLRAGFTNSALSVFDLGD